MGRILQGAGIGGFLCNLDVLYVRANPESAAWRALVVSWREQHQGTSKGAGDLFPLVAEVEADMLVNGRDDVGRKKSFGKALARAGAGVYDAVSPALADRRASGRRRYHAQRRTDRFFRRMLVLDRLRDEGLRYSDQVRWVRELGVSETTICRDVAAWLQPNRWTGR
jgi:hypothetical protein